jgi:hypothetical protein
MEAATERCCDVTGRAERRKESRYVVSPQKFRKYGYADFTRHKILD